MEKSQETRTFYFAVPESRLVWRHWPEDALRTEAEPLYLVYDTVSDYTHLLNSFAVEILHLLQQKPFTWEMLVEKILEEGLVEKESFRENEIRRFIEILCWKGLLDRFSLA
ncbi:MAG: hypothetical protein Q4C96_07700 [Planctomycetia bacterium]|nr:hypothetical protein [Planctomycetia bacterium]